MKNIIKIGTRSSLLAVKQTEIVKDMIKKIFPNIEIKMVKLMTKGDRILDVPLSKIGSKGLFTEEIENALLNNEIDLAVHSAKDMPTKLPDKLELAAFFNRVSPLDAIVSQKGYTLKTLPIGATVGTSSLRRIAQMNYHRADLKLVSIRGNINTRIKKMMDEKMDAIILAEAGLIRLDIDEDKYTPLTVDEMIPAVGQGALALEVNLDNLFAVEIAKLLNDYNTAQAVLAERAFLRKLEGGCQVPIGAIGDVIDDKLYLTGIVASTDGKKVLKDKVMGTLKDPISLGEKLANMLIEKGGDQILLCERRKSNE